MESMPYLSQEDIIVHAFNDKWRDRNKAQDWAFVKSKVKAANWIFFHNNI